MLWSPVSDWFACVFLCSHVNNSTYYLRTFTFSLSYLSVLSISYSNAKVPAKVLFMSLSLRTFSPRQYQVHSGKYLTRKFY